jgi:hypothetical protein
LRNSPDEFALPGGKASAILTVLHGTGAPVRRRYFKPATTLTRELAMTMVNATSRISTDPATRLGFWSRLWRWVRQTHTQREMDRFAPTRKM